MATTTDLHQLVGYSQTFHQAFTAQAQKPVGDAEVQNLFTQGNTDIPANDNVFYLNSGLDDADAVTFPDAQIHSDDNKPCYGYDEQGYTFYRQGGEGLWIPAYKHVNIRQWLLEDSDRIGAYDIEREHGQDPLDRTSFLISQKTWGKDRDRRTRILFQISPPANRSTNQHQAETMWRYGRMVIGSDDIPIKDYHNIPDTISTAIEGHLMEAIEREDQRIKHQDFRARMLPLATNKVGKVVIPPSDNTLSARMRRFRNRACLYCWGMNRDGSDLDKEFIEKKLPRQCREANSTQGFRDLYEHELVERELLTFGRCVSRAGGRGIQDAVRNKRKAHLQAKYERFLKEHEEIYGQEAEETGNAQEDEALGEDYGLPEFDPARVYGAEQEDITDRTGLPEDANAAYEEVGKHQSAFRQQGPRLMQANGLISNETQPFSRKRNQPMREEDENPDYPVYKNDSRIKKKRKDNLDVARNIAKNHLHKASRQSRRRHALGKQTETLQNLKNQNTHQHGSNQGYYDGSLNAHHSVRTSKLQPYISEHPYVREQGASLRSTYALSPSIPNAVDRVIAFPVGPRHENIFQEPSTKLVSTYPLSIPPTLSQSNHSWPVRQTGMQPIQNKYDAVQVNLDVRQSSSKRGGQFLETSLVAPIRQGSGFSTGLGSTQRAFEGINDGSGSESSVHKPWTPSKSATCGPSIPDEVGFGGVSLAMTGPEVSLHQTQSQTKYGRGAQKDQQLDGDGPAMLTNVTQKGQPVGLSRVSGSRQGRLPATGARNEAGGSGQQNNGLHKTSATIPKPQTSQARKRDLQSKIAPHSKVSSSPPTQPSTMHEASRVPSSTHKSVSVKEITQRIWNGMLRAAKEASSRPTTSLQEGFLQFPTQHHNYKSSRV